MYKQNTIEIDGFIIEIEFFYDEYWDTANGQHVFYSEIIVEKSHIISVVDTERNELITQDDLITNKHWDLVDKWLETNDTY